GLGLASCQVCTWDPELYTDQVGGALTEATDAQGVKITNPRIDRIYAAMKSAGMYGGKVTGAGGGVHMMACCDPQRRPGVAAAAEALGAEIVPFQFVFHGLRTWHTDRADEAGRYLPRGPLPPARETGAAAEPPPAGAQ
ncbi:MAG: hypothetical protein ACYS5V_12950, partial [Planctomycetota bacterium]